MKHPEEVKRLFTKPDGEVLQQSEVQLISFQENKEAFVARFPELADPFEGVWAECIANARALPPDYVAVAEQAAQTSTLENLMEQGRTLFQTAILYTQMAFPGDAAKLRLFGQTEYDSARTSQIKLPILLRSIYAQVTKEEYRPALLAKGLTEEEIGMLNGLAAAITEQDIAQQNAKKARSLAATARIETMNAVWEKMATVCQCAKLVFQNNAAKYNLFLLTDAEAPKENPPAPISPS